MALTVVLISLLVIGVGVGASKFSDYRWKIRYSDARFIRAYGGPDNSWHGFAYGLCSYTEGKFQDVNCTLYVEKPFADSEVKIKSCKIKYSREKELQQHNLSVIGFDSNWAKLAHLDENRLILQMPINGTDFYNRSAVYSFVNMDTCEIVNRYYIVENNMEMIYSIITSDDVMLMAQESKMCGSLRNCTIYVDFNGKDKTQPTELSTREQSYINENGQEKDLPLQIAVSESHGIAGACKELVNNSSDNNATTYNCHKKGYDSIQELDTTFEVNYKSILTNVYNLPNGGLLAFTTDCGESYNNDGECNRFDIHKINKDGLYEGHVAITEMQPHIEMEFLVKDDEFCMFAVYTPDQKTKDQATLHEKCIKNNPFFKFSLLK